MNPLTTSSELKLRVSPRATKPLTLQLLSDLHLELHADYGKSFIERLDSTGVDVLVLAGDVLSARFYTIVRETLERFASKYPRILYVPGNHELWGSEVEEGLRVLRSAASAVPGVTLLLNDVTVIDGHRFVGGTMWFPEVPPAMEVLTHRFPDYTEIEGFRAWHPEEVKRWNAFIGDSLKPDDIVITHHLPTAESISPRYARAELNHFFLHPMSSAIKAVNPRAWLHGHTHDSIQYVYGGCQVACNPFGYPTQLNKKYVEKLLIVAR